MALMAIESIPQQSTSGSKSPKPRRNAIKLPPSMRETVLRLMSDYKMTQRAYEVIESILLHDYNVKVSIPELRKLYAAYGNRVAEIRKEKFGGVQADAKKLKAQADALLKKRLTRAFEDENKRDALRAARDAGAIDDMDYKREVKKLPEIPTSELIKIANHFKEPEPKQPQLPALPPPAAALPEGERAFLEQSPVQKALADAISRGDTVELQRILYSGTPKPQSSTSAEAAK